MEFLDSKTFCKNSRHIKGEVLMRKRHLEMLGYRVVQVKDGIIRRRSPCVNGFEYSFLFEKQIPHFEWNSMELSTPDAWKDYLKSKIFKELSS